MLLVGADAFQLRFQILCFLWRWIAGTECASSSMTSRQIQLVSNLNMKISLFSKAGTAQVSITNYAIRTGVERSSIFSSACCDTLAVQVCVVLPRFFEDEDEVLRWISIR